MAAGAWLQRGEQTSGLCRQRRTCRWWGWRDRERQREERERERETRVVATEEHSRGVFSFFELMGKLASRWVRGRKGGSVSPGAIPAAL